MIGWRWRRKATGQKGGGVDLGVLAKRARVLLLAWPPDLPLLSPLSVCLLAKQKRVRDPSNVIAWAEAEGLLMARRGSRAPLDWVWSITDKGKAWCSEPLDSGTPAKTDSTRGRARPRG